MTVKFVERTRKRALSILAHIKKLQDEESLMTPEFARSQAEIVRAIDISQEIESWMSELANLLPMGACTSMPMKSLRLELRDASKIRRPSSLEVSELRRKIDITMSEHIAMLHAREHIRDRGQSFENWMSSNPEQIGGPRSSLIGIGGPSKPDGGSRTGIGRIS